jgi:hypothetical protein
VIKLPGQFFQFSPARLFFLILLLNSIFLYGQETGNFRGTITDSTTGEALAYANVFVKEAGVGAATDKRGNFLIIGLPADHTYNVVFSFIGYDKKELKVKIEPDKITHLNVQLVPVNIELQTVEKIGEKVIQKNATNIGKQTISIRQLEVMPKGVETDVLRSLQYLSGVRTTGDVSARYYVRGGTGDENLVLLNGVPVYNPFHALGLFSVIDPDMINSVEFYKGGFTAEYGGRLSSVLDITTKNGNQKSYDMAAEASFLTGKMLLEGPLPHGSFIFTGRKSLSTGILKKFLNDQSVPINFYDASFKLNFSNPEFLNNGRFLLFGFLSGDIIDYDNPSREDFNWKNNLLGFEWLQVYDVPLYSRLGLSFSGFNGKVNPNESNIKPKENQVTDVNFSFDLTNVFESKDELGAGFNFKALSTKLNLTNKQGIATDLNEFGGSFSIYGKYKFLRFENFGLDAGIRYNLTGVSKNGGGIAEPRISATYRPLPFFALKGAWGIYSQEVSTIADENEVINLFEPWVITPEYLTPSTALHYIIGTEVNITGESTIDIEGYYKIVHNLPLINQEKVLSTEPDLISGRGESYGWEFSYKYVTPALSIITSYTLSWAYRSVGDYLYYPRYDSRHGVNLSVAYDFGGGWQASAVWSFNSGLPFTPLAGYYDKYFPTEPGTGWYSDDFFRPYLILGDRNIERLPSYHRLDLSVSKSMQLGFLNLAIDVSVLNVYNRENIFYFKRETGERVNMLPVMPTATIKIKI